MTSNPPTMSLGDIELRTKNYAGARDLLGNRVRQLQDEMDAARRKAEPLIKSALAAAKAAESELSAAILQNPQHFKRPRTFVFHGVRVGIEKRAGKVVIADPAKTITLIRKHFSDDQIELLIKVKETPIKKAIAALPANDLKRIAVDLGESGDAVLIKPVDDELEKMLKALLKTDAAEVEEDAD